MPLEFKPVALSANQRKKAEKAGVSIASMEEADKYRMLHMFAQNI